MGLGRDGYVFAVYHPCTLFITPGVLISGHIGLGVIINGMKLDVSKFVNVTRIPNMASEIGALSHIFGDIDGLVLSARRPSLAAPPRGPQMGRYLYSHHSSPSSYFLTKVGFNIFQMP